MGTQVISSSKPAEDAFAKTQSVVSGTEYQIDDIIPDQRITVTGKRDYSMGLLIVLIIVGVITFGILILVAIAYYFTRKCERITITFQNKDEGCTITLIVIGSDIQKLANDLSLALKDN